MQATINHSRLDRDHYIDCKPCYEDHMDLLEDMRQDEGYDA